MKRRSSEVDRYIRSSAVFARPVLRRLRTFFHRADPRISETIKWGVPHFEYQGILGSMAAFRKHVSVGFWKGGMIGDEAGVFESAGNRKMTMLRMRDVADVPSADLMLVYIRRAVALNERGMRIPARKRTAVRVAIPSFFSNALRANRKASDVFSRLSRSHQREYVDWLTEAKREETRQRRMATAIKWLSEGKPRNWKYMK